MPIPLLLGIGAGITGAASLAKGITGAVQSSRAAKGLRNIQAPTYQRPQEANELIDLYRQQAAVSQMPGQEGYESRMGAGVAGSVADIQRTASSSAAALGAITDIHGRKQDAIRDLAVQFAEYKTARQRDLAQGLQQGAQYSDREFEMNKWMPYQVRMNELTSQKQAGAANLWGGIEGMGSAFMNLAGTQSYMDVLKGMQPQYGGGTGGVTQMAAPNLGAQSPFTQNRLNETILGLRGEIKR